MFKSEVEKLRNAIVQGSNLLPDDIALTVPELFETWKVGEALAVNDKRTYNGKLYKVVQAHTTQLDWKPDTVPALFVEVAKPNEIPDFKQPTGVHDAYMIGEKVMFNGSIYESLIDNNVYSPTAYPQGWRKL